jgi:thiopurine S-methyltransferase
MAYLATSFACEVVGVEGIRIALEEFVQENPDLKIIDPKEENQTSNDDGFERFTGQRITLLMGDFFGLDSTKAGGTFDLIFDRGSMVAIEPKMRDSYVEIISNLLGPEGQILLVALERKGPEEAMKEGPPYSIPEATVQEFFRNKDWVESVTMLESSDQLERKPEDRERYPDLDQLLETVYLIKRKG